MERIDNKKAYDMVPQTWKIDYLKTYKISVEVINFTKTMNNWKVELTVKGQTQAEMKIPRFIFQGESFLTTIRYRNDAAQLHTKEVRKFTKSQEKINRRMHMNDINVFTKKNEKELDPSYKQ